MADMHDDDDYNDSHRAFLQAFMARGTLTFSEAQPLLAAILSAHTGEPMEAAAVDESLFQAYISAVSRAVGALDYEVRSAAPQHELDGSGRDQEQEQRRQQRRIRTAAMLSNSSAGSERVWALINAASDAPTQLATTLAADELAFVKRVLDAIFERNNTLRCEACVVSGKAALQLHSVRDGASGTSAAAAAAAAAAARRRTADGGGQASLSQAFGGGQAEGAARVDGGGATQGGIVTARAAQGITMTQAQAVLDSLVAQGWLEVSRRGNYGLTPRALLELRPWLLEIYNDDDDDDDNDDAEDDGGGERDDDSDSSRPRRRIKMCAACRDIVTVGQRCPRLRCPGRLHDACTRPSFTMQQAERCPVCRRDWHGHGFVGERALDARTKPLSSGSSSFARQSTSFSAGESAPRRSTAASTTAPRRINRRGGGGGGGLDGAEDGSDGGEGEEEEVTVQDGD